MTPELPARKIKVHVYPDAAPHKCDTIEHPDYANTVPLGQKGLADHAELVGPEEAEFFYMGQFHYEETLRAGGFRTERFPLLKMCPERHIADIEGDWDHRHLPPALWDCVLMMCAHSKGLPGRNIFVRPANSRLLTSSQLRRFEKYAFLESRIRLGFRGRLTHHWVRLLLHALTMKWGLPCDWVPHAFGFGDTSPESEEVKDYEHFMFQHGLALCPRGAPDASMRFYEACFYSCVPIIVGSHGVVGDDYHDTGFVTRIHPHAGEQEMLCTLSALLATPYAELCRRAEAARDYFDDVVRLYYTDPTAFFLRWLVRHKLWGA